MAVREDTVRRPDGSTGVHGVVESTDIALVIPVDGERVQLVEQYRHPVGGRRWELPSGSSDVGDADLAVVAARELQEETGLGARTWRRLGSLEISPSTFSQRCEVFLATDLTYGAPQREPAEQDMPSAWFARAELEGMIRDGVIVDAKSTAAYALLLLHEQAAI
jgi:8-oxo-dGTP pyrophosphatase MutT (NUDIX family)